ncbi:hypothetical protein V492_06502 [Pseudogymnoascus sp. VKM F-4246]|nr:hypothetical protein V492_06502 [Pseudogymnoascus sp. VKM F-4246]
MMNKLVRVTEGPQEPHYGDTPALRALLIEITSPPSSDGPPWGADRQGYDTLLVMLPAEEKGVARDECLFRENISSARILDQRERCADKKNSVSEKGSDDPGDYEADQEYRAACKDMVLDKVVQLRIDSVGNTYVSSLRSWSSVS